jgi:hypothetical protein
MEGIVSALKDGTQRAALDSANPNTLADQLKLIAFGSVLQGQVPQVRRHLNPVTLGASLYCLSTLNALHLKDGATASIIQKAYCRAGAAGIPGDLTVAAFGATPTTGQIAIAPNGDIVTLGTDAITDLDVTYLPERGDVVESVFPVVSNVLTIPTALTNRGVVRLLEAESLDATAPAKLSVLIQSASAATTGTARLDLAKATVKFYSGDAVTRARVKLLVATSDDLNSILEAAAVTI